MVLNFELCMYSYSFDKKKKKKKLRKKHLQLVLTFNIIKKYRNIYNKY